MKLVTYSTPRKTSQFISGMLWGEWILDISDITQHASQLKIPVSSRIRKIAREDVSILDLVGKGHGFMDEIQKLSWRFFNRIKPEKIPRTLKRAADIVLHAPIPRPPVLRDFYAFEQHVKNARARRGLEIPKEWYDFPAFYYSNPTVVYGPEENVPSPVYTEKLDYELEVACIIGEGGKNIREDNAEKHIAGYTIMNDWSARDVQVAEMKIGLGPAKAKDFATSIGPWLVTLDELQDRKIMPGKYSLDMSATVNGKRLSHGNMDTMHWTFPQMIARASQSVRLAPGEIFGSGTMGNGSLLELGEETHRWLKPGDLVELEIERLGLLRNRVIESTRTEE